MDTESERNFNMTVNIFVSKISVINHVTKIKRRNNLKKTKQKKKKKNRIAMHNKAFHNIARIPFSYFEA